MAWLDTAQSTSNHPAFYKDFAHPEFDNGGNMSKKNKGGNSIKCWGSWN